MANVDKTDKKEPAAIDPMAQVRELLFGEAERRTQQTTEGLEAKLNQARSEIEARLAKIEATAERDRMEARERHAAAIRGIGELIERVGREIVEAADRSGSK
jgi:hypothetical protein